MENKEIKITVPEGYEIDKENSTFECIKFKKKGLTYSDVCHALFLDKDTYYIGTTGSIDHMVAKGRDAYSSNNASSTRQLEQLLAINKLMNVAAYLNEKTLDWDDSSQSKYFIYYRHDTHTFGYGRNCTFRESLLYFDSERHAEQAVEIIGEDVVKLALGVFD